MSDLVTIREQIREVTWVWWLLVLLGILGLVAGVIVIAAPGSERRYARAVPIRLGAA